MNKIFKKNYYLHSYIAILAQSAGVGAESFNSLCILRNKVSWYLYISPTVFFSNVNDNL